jgi:hypothetical protein
MGMAAFTRGMDAELIIKDAQAKSIALFAEQVHQGCGSKHAEPHLIPSFLFRRKVGILHRRRSVYNDLATQVGLFFKFFGIEPVCPGKYFPIDVADGFTGVIKAVFGKFYRETVKGTFMQPDDKSFYDLVGQELEVIKFPKLKLIEIVHRVEIKDFRGGMSSEFTPEAAVA